MSLNVRQFGSLYHGTDAAGVSELQQTSPRYSRMQKSYGWNYATTDLHTAVNYARDAASQTRGVPTVYEVQPKRKSDQWGPDPDSGPNGFGDGPRNKREAMDIHESGGEVSLRFRSPLKVVREVWQENKARDISDSVRGPRSFR